MLKIYISLTLFILVSIVNYCGEENNTLNYEINNIISEKDTVPFWIKTNNYGRIGENDRQIIGSMEILHKKNMNGIGIEFGSEFNFDIIEKSNDNVDLEQMYIDTSYGKNVLSLGRKKREEGINFSELSTGSLLVSENAKPIPQIRIGSPDYIKVPHTFSKAYFKWFISNGWLERDRKVKSPMLHEKELDVKLKLNEKLTLYGSLRHDVIWGGTNPDGTENPHNSVKDFLDVFFARGASGENSFDSEKLNKAGDHKGLYQLRGEYDFKEYKTTLLTEFFFEDGSGREINQLIASMIKKGDFPAKMDGKYGFEIELKNNDFIKNIFYEYINTKYQSGSGLDNITGGRDYYYQNWLYGGWIYRENIIGNPLYIIKENKNYVVDTANTHTRFDAQNFGVNGNLTDTISYRINLTFVDYHLSYAYVDSDQSNPMKKIFDKGLRQNYFLVELKKSNIMETPVYSILSFGYDDGEIIKDVFGGKITLGTNIIF